MSQPLPSIHHAADPMPPDEAARLDAVRRYAVSDAIPDAPLDRITALAARRFDVPVAAIAIVDRDRIWLKSRHGVALPDIARDPGLSASAIRLPEPWSAADARRDPRPRGNPLIAAAAGMSFYAGAPLQTPDGHALGMFCVMDNKPRDFDRQQIDDLQDFAAVVMDQLDLRLSLRQAAAQARTAVQEIDHRVMNSLQFVSGLLSMQGRAAGRTEVSKQLATAANRVSAVARVHQHFYLQDDDGPLSCLGYLERLCGDLAAIFETPVTVEGTDALVPAAQLLPIGLLVNELVTNASKHGGGGITVSFATRDGEHRLTVRDGGDGLPPDFDISAGHNGGLGLKIVTTLARQLAGRVEVRRDGPDGGAFLVVSFPSEDASEVAPAA
jgi:two-component sensor histidine kinase